MDRTTAARQGLLVVPGFIDLHAHLREPGFEDAETIATGAMAALRGGFTTIKVTYYDVVGRDGQPAPFETFTLRRPRRD